MPDRVTGASRLLVLLAATLGIALAAPLSALGRDAPANSGVGPTGAGAAIVPFTLDLSQRGDFVAQTNFVQCVGASMQMMLNMIRPTDDVTADTQGELQVLARALSAKRTDRPERKGASVTGWTAGLNALGAGPYRTVGATDIQTTLKLAARAMRDTNRPVGLLMWRGRHAWVMAGFTATADPRVTSRFEVTGVIVMDPLYPYGSRTWGASPVPRESLSVEELGRQFVPRGSRGEVPGGGTTVAPNAGVPASGATTGWSRALSGKYVIVMPFMHVDAPRLGPAPR